MKLINNFCINHLRRHEYLAPYIPYPSTSVIIDIFFGDVLNLRKLLGQSLTQPWQHMNIRYSDLGFVRNRKADSSNPNINNCNREPILVSEIKLGHNTKWRTAVSISIGLPSPDVSYFSTTNKIQNLGKRFRTSHLGIQKFPHAAHGTLMVSENVAGEPHYWDELLKSFCKTISKPSTIRLLCCPKLEHVIKKFHLNPSLYN